MSRPLKPLHRKTVALVLGSGSSRGWAHIGAIEALGDEGIPIDFIFGPVTMVATDLHNGEKVVLKMDFDQVNLTIEEGYISVEERMDQKQRAYYCVNCSTNKCPHKDEPAIIIARYLYPPSCGIERPLDSKLEKRIRTLCETCCEYVEIGR